MAALTDLKLFFLGTILLYVKVSVNCILSKTA